MYTQSKLVRKIYAWSSLFAITLNILQPTFLVLTLAPTLAPRSINAEEVEPTPTPDPTVAPSADPITSPDPTPTPELSLSPEPTPTSTPDPTIESSPVPTDTPATPAPSTNSSPAPPELLEIEPQVAEPSAQTVNSSEPKVAETTKLSPDQEVVDSANSDWNINETEGSATTKESVGLGIKYIFPLATDVTVTFTSLPADQSLRAPLKIEKVKISDLNLDDDVKPYGEYAYDVTTNMVDGTFEYDITLPKADDQVAEVLYMEDANSTPILIDDNKTSQEGSVVKVNELNHFTIFIVTSSGNGPVLTTILVNNQTQVTVSPNETITATIRVTTSGSGNSDDWRSTEYRIEGEDWECVDTPDFTNDITNQPATFSFSAPSNIGIYDIEFRAYNLANCNDSGSGNPSSTVKLNNAIIVQYSVVANPNLNATCGIDVGLIVDTSTSIDNTELGQMKTALKAFVNAFIGTPTQMAVVSFDDEANLESGFTSDLASLTASGGIIDDIDGSGYTNWEDAINDTLLLFPNRADKPDLIVFTSDGNPTASSAGPADTNQPNVHLAPSIVQANLAKAAGIRIITLGIGDDLSPSNLQAISSVDAYYSAVNFETLTATLQELATDLCGSTVSVTKLIDADGKINTTNDRTPASGWTFNIGGQADQVTDVNGQTNAVTLSPNTGYSVTETVQAGYSLLAVSCTGATDNGVSNGTNAITGIQLGSNDIVSCTFINSPIQKIDICHATNSQQNPYILNSPDRNGDVSGHDDHNGGVWYPGIADHSWGDIIPPFDYIGGSYPGKNWTSQGQAIYNNGCNIPNGTLTVTKTLLPPNDPGLFNLTINGTAYVNNVGNGGTTGSQIVIAGSYTVGETAGTNTNLSDYVSTYGGDCDAQGQVTVGVGETKSCTITNTRRVGEITFIKQVIGGTAQSSDWEFDILGVGTFQNGTFIFNTGSYSITETTNVLGYSMTGVSGICSNPNLASGSATLTVTEQGGTCTFTNTRDTGSVKVNKLVDTNGDNQYEGGNTAANNLGFTWSLDGVGTNDMGVTVSNVPTTITGVTHTVNESMPTGYHFVGWYPTADTSKSCANPTATTLPITVNVSKNATTEITLCNQRDTGSIRITKDVLNGTNSQDFNFTGTLGNFALDDDSNGTLSNTRLFSGLGSGVYTITEGATNGWALHSLTCTGDTEYQVQGSTATIDLDQGENVVCTFVNRQQTGTITIIKEAIPTSENNFSFDVNGSFPGGDFELEDDGNDNNGGTEESKTVTGVVGQYTVTEDGESGWALTNLVCNDQNSTVNLGNRRATINLEDGEHVTCTFTNQRLATLIIKKDATNHSDNNFRFDRSWGSDFELEDDGNDNNGGTDETATFSNLTPGSYTVTEHNEPGWALTKIVCSDQTVPNLSNRSVSVDLTYNETVTCTFYNTKLGRIKGEKFNDRNGDGDQDDNENGLDDWRIFIDANINSVYDNGETYDWTDNDGAYELNNLMPGTYRVCEEMQNGWYNSAPVCQTTTITPGDTDEINFANHQELKIRAYKIVCELESDLPNWGSGAANITAATAQNYVDSHPGCRFEEGWDFQYGYDGQVSKYGNGDQLGAAPAPWHTLGTTNSDGYAEISLTSLVRNDGIWVREVLKENYVAFSYPPAAPKADNYSAEIYCHKDVENYDNFDQIEGTYFGDTYYCVAFNALNTGDLEVTKYNDLNGDGDRDEGEPTLAGWEINVEGETSVITDDEGRAIFTDLVVGNYSLSETMQDGWVQTNISCDQNNQQQDSYHTVTVNPGATTYCEIGNQEKPVLTITKSNNAGGSLGTGALVLYTLTVNLTGSNLTGVVLTDLPPTDFVYQSGSWTANSDVRGDIKLASITTEPTYASPGAWQLGDMVAGETVTLTYQARIGNDVEPGTYRDLAWVIGNSAGWGDTYGNQVSEPYTFVGTEVTVDRSLREGRAIDIQGQVLGASTMLPATGIDTNWLILALGLLFAGLCLIFGGRMIKRSLLIVLFLILPLFGGSSVMAADDPSLSIRLESPKTPTRLQSQKLAFSVLNTSGDESITVRCYARRPGDGGFSTYGPNIIVAVGGNSGNCELTPALVSTRGTYEFYVTAMDGSGIEEASNSVSMVYENEGPGTPHSYSKERPSECKYVLKFQTANDSGRTTSVEIYRSQSVTFTADGSTYVGGLSVESDKEYTYTHDFVSDCDKTWYYVVRAFDNAGNGSGLVGDTVTTTAAGESVTGAAIVTTTTSTGSILGSESDSSTNSGDMAGESDEIEIQETTGSVLSDMATAATRQPWWWYVVAVLAVTALIIGVKRLCNHS